MARKVSEKKVKDFVKQRLAAEIAEGTPKGQIRKRVLAAAKEEFGAGAIDWMTIIQLILALLEAFKK